ncbi:MAG TPA: outer membrane lipoprotein LolB [Usitatibacter sp.]
MHLRAATCLAALFIAACASVPAPLPRLAAAPGDFEVSGRLAVRQGERSDIAKLRWTRQGLNDSWIIASPLGNEVARLESGASGATLVRAGGASESAGSFRALTERVLGVPLDPDEMAGWLHGAPASGAGDWKVTIDQMQRAGNVDLAKRITATRGDMVVRLIVDEYRALGE